MGEERRDKVRLYRDEKGGWRWRRLARNGRIVSASSESFTRRHDAKRNFERSMFERWGWQ